MVINAQKDILIAPLDWGLGHTTRCVPVMRYLLELGHCVVFAGNEWQRRYINETFGGIETIHLDGYGVTYSRRGSGFMFSLLYQLPGLITTIRNEHKWLAALSKERRFDAVISDNRYGLFHSDIPCVMMTHQLLAQTGMGDTADNMLRRLHYKYIKRFGQCWVVDVPGAPNLSGKLAHPSVLPGNAKYIGLLSQLSETADEIENADHHLLVLLSGPEPQRSILSGLLWEQLRVYKGSVVFVEGSRDAGKPADIPANISWHAQLTKNDLLPLIQEASLVICRSGYSTLMDLVGIGKKAVIIPTPGQTEQVYLGKYLHEQGVFYSVPQKKFRLDPVLKDVAFFPFRKLALSNAGEGYKNAIDAWLKDL